VPNLTSVCKVKKTLHTTLVIQYSMFPIYCILTKPTHSQQLCVQNILPNFMNIWRRVIRWC